MEAVHALYDVLYQVLASLACEQAPKGLLHDIHIRRRTAAPEAVCSGAVKHHNDFTRTLALPIGLV